MLTHVNRGRSRSGLGWATTFSLVGGLVLATVGAAGCGDDPQGNAGTGGQGGNGAGGMGGADVTGECATPDPGPLDYIDDMEDGNATLLFRGGRMAAWYTFSDETEGVMNPAPMSTPVMEPIPQERCAFSYKAMRVTGSGFSDWGSGFGFDFKTASVNGTWTKLPYDASDTRGITFWARVGDPSITNVRLAVVDQWSDPQGGHCDQTVTGGDTACWDHFSSELSLTTEWHRFAFNWGQLTQRAFGLPRDNLDTANLLGVQFQLPASAPVFDVWIDDIAFFK
jgi:hypothetical protein